MNSNTASDRSLRETGETRNRGRLALSILTLWLAWFSLAARLQAQSDLPSTGDITGSLQIFGCTPSPAQFRIFALPLYAGTGRPVPPSDETGRPVEATMAATRDPHTVTFTVPAVQFGAPYQLRIQAGPGSCGRFFWESEGRGLALGGGAPVRLVAYAVKSKIEVLGSTGGARTARAWVGADHLDVQDPSQASRQFRWSSDHPGVTGGVLQVSTERFPKQGETTTSCLAPAGLVHSASFTTRGGGWISTPTVNFTGIAQRIAAGRGGDARMAAFAMGAPFYIRVVPMAGRTPLCNSLQDGPSPWVTIANAGRKSGVIVPGVAAGGGGINGPDVKITFGTKFVPSVSYENPKGNETAYRVTKEHPIVKTDVEWGKNAAGWPTMPKDWYGYLFLKYGSFTNSIPVGARLWTWPGNDGFDLLEVFEAGVKIVTGFIDAVGFAVDFVADAYEDAKALVVKIAAKAISVTGINCGPKSLCEDLVETALATGLSAMGLPPSLPNWSEVVDQGFEYMAYQLASQAGVANVPGATELTEAAAKAIVNEAIKNMKQERGVGSGLPEWLSFDLGQDPAILTLTVDRLYSSAFQTNVVRIYQNKLFEGVDIKLPSVWPKGTASAYEPITIPVALHPNNAGFVPPHYPDGTPYGDEYFRAKVARDAWRTKVNSTTCVPFIFWGLATSGNLILGDKGGLGAFGVDPSYVSYFPVGTCPAN